MSREHICKDCGLQWDGIKGSEFQQLSEQIAAIADGLRARDRQLSAISEQIQQLGRDQAKNLEVLGNAINAMFKEADSL